MIKKISINDLQVGMYVVDTGLSWIDHPYLYAEEGEVKSPHQIDQIFTDGFKELFIDTDKGSFKDMGSVRIYEKGMKPSVFDEEPKKEDIKKK